MVKLVTRSQVLMEIPYYVEQNLVQVKPKRVKVGETFTIQIKGVGWSELDNTLAVTYDNATMGYACGFNSNGDVTINLVATGHPGTHLIDIYPAIYKGKDKVPLNYQTPFLTYARDFPALALGYRLPAYRLAIEVGRVGLTFPHARVRKTILCPTAPVRNVSKTKVSPHTQVQSCSGKKSRPAEQTPA